MDFNSVLTALLLFPFGIIVTLLLVERALRPHHARNEPPIVASRIPFIGHLLGLFKHGTRYFSTTRY